MRAIATRAAMFGLATVPAVGAISGLGAHGPDVAAAAGCSIRVVTPDENEVWSIRTDRGRVSCASAKRVIRRFNDPDEPLVDDVKTTGEVKRIEGYSCGYYKAKLTGGSKGWTARRQWSCKSPKRAFTWSSTVTGRD